MLLPHHIGYRQGYRGINWSTFTPEFSPAVEIMSMHGTSESDDAPQPYLHTMGPLDWHSSYQYGLAQGHVTGVFGSTDHHSAHPGSYGHGRLAVWSEQLTRTAIWEAIQQRRTVALTGDNIALALALNGQPLGAVVDATPERQIEIEVAGGDALDYVEILHNNRVLQRWNGSRSETINWDEPLQVHFEVGWGNRNEPVEWAGRAWQWMKVSYWPSSPVFAAMRRWRPRQRKKLPMPSANGSVRANRVSLSTLERGAIRRPRPRIPRASRLSVLGTAQTKLVGTVNGEQIEASLADLVQGSQSGYLGGFLTPAYRFRRAVPRADSTGRFALTHNGTGEQRDWYYVRVRQKNGQWAWSSPIWVRA